MASSAAATHRSPRPARRSTSSARSASSSPLLRVLHRSRLADHRDLDLTRVLHRLLDLLRDVARQARAREVVDLLRLHDDADLAPGLDGERLLDALERVRDPLELLQALDVIRDDLAAGARPCGADRVRGGDERPGHGDRL